jgi:hypothetical protein
MKCNQKRKAEQPRQPHRLESLKQLQPGVEEVVEHDCDTLFVTRFHQRRTIAKSQKQSWIQKQCEIGEESSQKRRRGVIRSSHSLPDRYVVGILPSAKKGAVEALIEIVTTIRTCVSFSGRESTQTSYPIFIWGDTISMMSPVFLYWRATSIPVNNRQCPRFLYMEPQITNSVSDISTYLRVGVQYTKISCGVCFIHDPM